ncbi:MAG TPA: hypothetical protein VF064_12165 [Pyrinomonadaceae bacterium]
MNRRSIRFIAAAFVCAALSLCALVGEGRGQDAEKGGGRGETVAFDSDRWVVSGTGVKREEHLGRRSLFLAGGAFAHLKDVEFEDGTIEVDVAASQPRAFLGVAFRFLSREEHEMFYLRPQKSGLADATQYTPAFNAAHPWQLYSGKGFTAAAEIPRDRWLHVRIEINGLAGRVYLDNAAEPVLVIEDLKRGHGKGSVGLWGSAMGGHFADFKFTAAKPSATRTAPQTQPTAAGVLTKWELSDAFDTAEKSLETLPAADAWKAMRWQAVTTEAPGILVIDRYRKGHNVVPAFAGDPNLRLQKARGPKAVYARARLHSEREQVKKLHFGYSDEVTVFLNGQPLFTGKSAFRFRDPGFLGIVDVENDAVHLPLRKGANELVLAVSEYFGGWGFTCRLQDTAGITLD